MEYEWDQEKAKINLKKHGVSFQEAASVFGDPLALTFNDPDHSIDEQRLLTFGITKTEKWVIVSHTEHNNILRIISARLMDKSERKIYENG
jgi:uncharacterized DUF497 family protein